MKSNMCSLVLLAAIGLITFFGWSVQGQKTPAPKVVWEHKVVVSLIGDNSFRLTQLGTEGWELVTVRSEEKVRSNMRQMEVTYYLKRAKPTEK